MRLTCVFPHFPPGGLRSALLGGLLVLPFLGCAKVEPRTVTTLPKSAEVTPTPTPRPTPPRPVYVYARRTTPPPTRRTTDLVASAFNVISANTGNAFDTNGIFFPPKDAYYEIAATLTWPPAPPDAISGICEASIEVAEAPYSAARGTGYYFPGQPCSVSLYATLGLAEGQIVFISARVTATTSAHQDLTLVPTANVTYGSLNISEVKL